VRTSPDGRRLALWIGVANDEVWTYEIERGILERVSQEAADPVWTPDGQWIVFSTFRGEADVVRVRADGSGEREVLLPREPAGGDRVPPRSRPTGGSSHTSRMKPVAAMSTSSRSRARERSARCPWRSREKDSLHELARR
jgi:hypothetical protein